MFGQGGSLFNLSLGDLGRFLEKANADPTRKMTKEINKMESQLNKMKEIASEQLSIDKKAVKFEEMTQAQLKKIRDAVNIEGLSTEKIRKLAGDLSQDKRKLEIQRGEERFKSRVTPRRGIMEVVDDMTGDFINLRDLSSAGITKATGALVGAMITPPLIAMSNLNDIIQEIGINNEHLLDTFVDINAETQQIARTGERLRGSSIGHLQTLISTQEVYGTMVDASMDTLDTVESFPIALGLSVEEGREFLNTMRGITAEGADFNASMMRSLAILSEGSNVPMGWMMSDISENAEFFAQRSGQGADNIATSVVHARRLGIQMGTIVNMLSGLDTVESVIESQMKLSLFTGEQINLLDSATANFFGDTEEATTSLLREIENIDEATFNLPFVRKQMAEQLNVSATEMNNIYESVKRIGAESTAMDLGFADDLESFRDMTTGIGMSRVRKSLNESILNPIRNALSENTKLIDNMFRGASRVVDFLGSSLIAPLFERLPQLIPILTTMGGVVGAIGLSNGIQIKQWFTLQNISAQLSAISAKMLGTNATGGFMSRHGGKMRNLGAIAGATTGGMMWANQLSQDSEDASWISSALGGAITGGSLGAMTATPFGILAGALGGGAIGLGTHALSHGGLGGGNRNSQMPLHGGLAEGGIATTPMLSPIAETRPEAVIPLDSSKTKEMMTLNLTDTSIEKLARAISKEDTNITIDYRYNGKKMDDSEQFFDEIRR